MLAIFWRRLGSPTGKAVSGTVEEIQRALKRDKKVMVYLSQRSGTDNEPPDSREQTKIERFKRRLGQIALYGTYGNVREFATSVRKDLALVMREVVATARKRR